MAEDTNNLAVQWKALSPQQRDAVMMRMTHDQKQKLAQTLGMRGGRGPVTVEAAPPKFSLPWWKSQALSARDKAIQYLPTIGGTAGGIVGAGAGEGVASVPAAAAGAAAGGTLGETARQALTEHFHPEDKRMTGREAATGILEQAAGQGGAELVGGGLGKLVGPSLKGAISKLYFAGNLGPREDLELVMPEIAAAEKDVPAKTVGDFIEVVGDATKKIASEVDTAMMHKVSVPGVKNPVPLGSVAADSTPIADRISQLATAHPSDVVANPSKIAAVKNRVARLYSQPRTYSWLNDRRTVLNRELNRFYAIKTPADQAQYLFQHPEFEIDKAEADAIRDVIYPQMDNAAGKSAGYFENLQRKRGALMSIEDQAQEHLQSLKMRSKQAKGAPYMDPLRTYGTTHGNLGFSVRLASAFHTPNVAAQANKQVAKAFGHTAGSKAGKAAATPVGREILALPLRMLVNPSEPENAPAPRLNPTDEWSQQPQP